MSSNKEVAIQQALDAILYEAKEQGLDVSKLCAKVKSGLLDSGNPYRYTSAGNVTTAQDAIDEALKFVNEQWKDRG